MFRPAVSRLRRSLTPLVNCGCSGFSMMEQKKQPVAAESRRLTRAGNLWSQRQGGLHECYQNWLYYSVVLIITLTAGGTRVSAYGATTPRRMVMRHLGGRGAVKCHAERSRVKRSFTKAQASQPWIHVALSLLSPFVRLLRRLTTAARPCGTRAAFAATNVAARAVVKCTSRATPSTQFPAADFAGSLRR